MNNFKATQTDWVNVEHSAIIHAAEACILELRSRVEALEAQGRNLKGSLTSSTPPPVATDEELLEIWISERASRPWVSRRAIYDLGVAHGQAGSREVAEPAPVAGELVANVAYAITEDSDGPINCKNEARDAILEMATWLRKQGWKRAAVLLEQEARR
jgi:hypothetical protein